MVSCMYASTCRIEAVPENRDGAAIAFGQPFTVSDPVRVRSRHASIGTNPGFGIRMPVQPAGLFGAVPVNGLPSGFRHGAFNVGSTIPNVSFSVSQVFRS